MIVGATRPGLAVFSRRLTYDSTILFTNCEQKLSWEYLFRFWQFPSLPDQSCLWPTEVVRAFRLFSADRSG